MNINAANIVAKVWNLADVLRDDGVNYSDYLEQITYLLFLKMADEKGLDSIPDTYNWNSLKDRSGAELMTHYIDLLQKFSNAKGMLGQIFTKSQNKIQQPNNLASVIRMIDEQEWSLMGSDVTGDIYEGLLAKNAEDTKSGAGQYFTPRALIDAMVACIQPQPEKTIIDPACGTGGFFLSAYRHIVQQHPDMDREEKVFLKEKTFFGNEIVANTRRLCLMNMYLHNIGKLDQEPNISSADALVSKPHTRYDYVLANPPFGKKSSKTEFTEDGKKKQVAVTYGRQDFWVQDTTNKQLNFLQHIRSLLKENGEAAVVLPDNVLFEGGAGETVRKELLKSTELHTILRLPTGIFYAHGVKANVLFFVNKAAAKHPWTKRIWIYDYRTNISHTLKQRPMKLSDLQPFVELYKANNRSKRQATWSEENTEGRWRSFTYEEVIARDKTNLDIFWLKDSSLIDLENLPDPDILAAEIIENLEAGLNSFKEILEEVGED